MTEFGKTVRQHFDFLIHEFGFVLKSDDTPVRYESATLYLELWSGKSEIDLILGVKIDTDVLRPYVSHVFGIAEIVRYYKTGPFPTFAAASAIPDLSENQRFVIYLAGLTKKYCADILRGDIAPLEKLSVNRAATQA